MTLFERRILFLQGPSSRFFAHVAKACRKAGAMTLRLGLCPGDRLYWGRSAGRYIAHRHGLDGFEDRLCALLRDEGITDLLMLGDARPAHALAVTLAREAGAVPWIVEHGYLRPDRILIEAGGMGARSTLPARFLAGEVGPEVPAPMPALPASFLRYAALDVGFHAANLALARVLYPGYRPHAVPPLREYAGWLGKAISAPRRRAGARAAEARIAAHAGPVFLFPLQLAHDVQLTLDGTGAPMAEVLAQVMDSFARHAPRDALLVVKAHPLDNGLTDWGRQVAGQPRAVWLDGGDLGALIVRAAGVVVVNSTVGLTALAAGRPVTALGQAIYAKAGLTDPQPLAGFWTVPRAPDRDRVAAFLRLLEVCHIRGAFDGPGAILGAQALAAHLAAHPGGAGGRA